MKNKQADLDAMERMRPGHITAQGFLGSDSRSLADIIEADAESMRRLDIDADKKAVVRAIAAIPQQICIPSAALWKIRKKQFAKMGGLSTDYIYAYYEDAAFGLEALKAGVPVTIDTSARWIHMEGVGKSMPPHVRSFLWLNRAHFSQTYADTPHVVDTLMDHSLL